MGIRDKYPLIAVDLFSGCGGLSYGLKEAGFKIGAAVEIDKNAIQTYINNIGKVVIEKDIREITGQELLNKAGLKKGDLFLLAGCPPCQGFSSQRNRKDLQYDQRNELVFEFQRLAEEMQPAFILMENVPGMMRGVGKEIFKKAKEGFKKLYKVESAILNAADYGVPQLRKRLVLHGIRKDVYEKYFKNNKDFILQLPIPTHRDPKDKKSDLPVWKTVEEIRDLPRINAGEEYEGEEIYNHRSQKLISVNLERIQYIREHGGSRDCLPESLQLECHKQYSGHKDVYGIMSWNKPAPTITGGCLSYSKGRFGHPEQDRAISAREAARLQSFPDKFIFYGSLTSIALQIGNAVPVKLAEASGEYFKKSIEIINFKKASS